MPVDSPPPVDSTATASTATVPDLQRLIGDRVIIDASSRYVFLGQLQEQTALFVILVEADAHDLRDTSTTRDSYVLDARRHGITANRREVWVRIDEIVAIARLSDVVV